MLVALTNARATIVGETTAAEKRFLYETLAYVDKAAERMGSRTPKVSLYSTFTNSFPAGLLSLVYRTAQSASPPVRLDIVDKRERPCEADEDYEQSFLEDFRPGGPRQLRDYQREAVRMVWQRTRGLLQLPTGAGKTTIAVAVVRSLPCRWLFVVDSQQLIGDAAARFREMTGQECGVIGDGQFTTGRFTVATLQTLYSRLDQPEVKAYLASVQGLIVDEAHILGADTFYNVVSAVPTAYYRVGLSGTPLSRTDRKSLLTVASLGSVIYSITPGELTRLGYLSKPTITMLQVKQVGGWGLHFSTFRRHTVVHSARRNAAVMEAIEAVRKPALVFIREIDHGRKLVDLIHQTTGFNAKLVHGEQDVEMRRQAVKALERRDIDIIVCSSVFTKGIDIPFLEGGVNAAGGESVIDTLQRLGRGLRITKDKNTFDWWDIADEGHTWLLNHAESRYSAYVEAGYTPLKKASLRALKVPDAPITGKKGQRVRTSPEGVSWSSGDDPDEAQ